MGSLPEGQIFFSEGSFLPFGLWWRNLPVSFCAFFRQQPTFRKRPQSGHRPKRCRMRTLPAIR